MHHFAFRSPTTVTVNYARNLLTLVDCATLNISTQTIAIV